MIANRPDELLALFAEVFVSKVEPGPARESAEPNGAAAILRDGANRVNGGALERLRAGDWGGYGSQSEADLALCGKLAAAGYDAVRIDAVFRRSGLFRKKWDEVHYGDGRTYGQATIEKALSDKPLVQGGAGARAGAANAPNSSAAPATTRGLPMLDAGEPYQNAAPKAWARLRTRNDPPRLFRHGGVMTRIETDDSGRVVLQVLDVDRLSYELGRAATWFRVFRGRRVPAEPRVRLVKDMLAEPEPSLPILTRIVEAPVFARDGSLQLEPGYHPGGRVYYAPAAGFTVPTVADHPTAADVAKARRLIAEELLGDFPFIGPEERAHAVALVLLPFARDLIDGATPLHLIEKPTPGTGATLLGDVVTLVALGRPAPVMTEARDEEEWRKRITATLLRGPSVIVIDNLKRRLDSAALSAAITASTWEDRILGVSRTARITPRCVWIASGNNPVLSTEMARRTARIRLNAKVEHPWDRSNFRHPDLRQFVLDSRGELVWAALTLIRAWIVAGRRPASSKALGGFEDWSNTIGGILENAGVDGFLSNAKDFYAASDAEGAAWRALVEDWYGRWGNTPVGVGDLWPLIEHGDYGFDFGGGNDRSQRTRFGKALGAMRDRQFDGLRIVADGTVGRAQRYHLEVV